MVAIIPLVGIIKNRFFQFLNTAFFFVENCNTTCLKLYVKLNKEKSL